MALPSSGQISMNDIRAELGVSSQSPFSLNTARQGGYVALNQFSPTLPPYSGQVSLSSWYSYCQNCGYSTTPFSYSSADVVTACGGTPSGTYYYSGTLGIGNTIYTNTAGSPAAAGYYSVGGVWYHQTCPDNCSIIDYGDCGGGGMTLEWLWTNNNVVEGGGGFIQIYVNGSNVVYTADSGNYTTTEYSGSFTVNEGDEIYVYVYSYGNASYGTETDLAIYNPNTTIVYAHTDIQFNPGSPSSETYTWNATAGGITILASSNSY